jgi:hypothetical protein
MRPQVHIYGGMSTGLIRRPPKPTVFGGRPELEYDLIRTRTAEGRSRAQKARAAHGPETEIDRGTAGRGPATTRRRCYPRGTGVQLRRGEEYDFEAGCPKR